MADNRKLKEITECLWRLRRSFSTILVIPRHIVWQCLDRKVKPVVSLGRLTLAATPILDDYDVYPLSSQTQIVLDTEKIYQERKVYSIPPDITVKIRR